MKEDPCDLSDDLGVFWGKLGPQRDNFTAGTFSLGSPSLDPIGLVLRIVQGNLPRLSRLAAPLDNKISPMVREPSGTELRSRCATEQCGCAYLKAVFDRY